MDTFERDGLTFDVTDQGPAEGPTAVLLHGFPQDRTSWNRVTSRLNEQGVRTLAPDQRGYSPGANPRGRSAYAMKELVRDVLALIDASGADKVHLVGHDWGGAAAWATAMAAPNRLASLTVLSTPHPYAMSWAIRHGGQWRKSLYMAYFNLPWLPERTTAGHVGQLLCRTGGPAEDAARYDARFATPASLTDRSAGTAGCWLAVLRCCADRERRPRMPDSAPPECGCRRPTSGADVTSR